ncbi:MAG: hypothetical protein KDK37_13615, partial [Leptospiraceae bacterium]|nr:hypothetical protein [Leptospiraceae bacterium]
MFFLILAGGGGIYLILMSFGLIHKQYMSDWNRQRKLGLRIMGAGFLIMGLYFGYMQYFLSTPEGKEIQ